MDLAPQQAAESDLDSGLARLQRYEPQREIGRGTYGRAVLVRDTVAGNALRVLKYVDLNGLAADAADRAVTEATILRRLAHPNIVRYHESFLAEGRLCIVTDYAPNGDLRQLLRRQAAQRQYLTDAVVWRMLQQLSDALGYLHEHQVVHRDLKPENVLVQGDGTLLLADFGASRALEHETKATTTIGTPLYLSPEICNHQPYDHKSDMWALGCVLYELITLDAAFPAASLSDLWAMIRTGAYRAISRPCHSVLRYLVHRLLSVAPSERPSACRLRLWRQRIEAQTPSFLVTAPAGAAAPVGKLAIITTVSSPAAAPASTEVTAASLHSRRKRPVSELSGPTTPDELRAPEQPSCVSKPEKDVAAWEVAGGLPSTTTIIMDETTDDASSSASPAPRVARPHGSSRQQQRKTMAAVARRLLTLLGVPARADAAPMMALPKGTAAVKEARMLLGFLRTTMERFLGADGLASVEAYVHACGASPPVHVTPGGSVVLPGADRCGRDGSSAVLAAFDRACATLPTFAPRELATVVVPTVHALLQWEHTAVATA